MLASEFFTKARLKEMRQEIVNPTFLQIENLAISVELEPYMRYAEILRDFRDF